MDIKITLTHSKELSKLHRVKYEKLVDKFISGLMDLPGVDCVVGPVFAETEAERKDRECLEIQRKAREQDQIKKAFVELFDSPGYQAKLAAAIIHGLPEEG